MKKPPKYQKKAHQWFVTEFGEPEKGKGGKIKQKQNVHWFSTLEEATRFYSL